MQVKSPGVKKTVLTVVAAAVIAGGVYGGYAYTAGEDEAADGEPLQVPVSRGDLLESVSSDGSITFPERADLSFDTQGDLASINVSPGDSVSTGDTLATLDELTVADLATAVERAETEVSDAQDRLSDARSSADALDITNAESAIVAARAALEDANDQLAALLKPSDEELLGATADVTKAEKDLADAQEALSDLRAPADESDLLRARTDVTKAEKTLDDAQEALSDLRASADESDLLRARTDVTKAEKTLDDAREALSDLQALPDTVDIAAAASTVSLANEAYVNAIADLALEEARRQTELEDARTAITDARDAYAATYMKWLGIALAESEVSMPPSEVLAANSVDLANLFDPNTTSFSFGAPENDPATAWNELTVFVWTWLAVEPVAGVCDADSPPLGTACVNLELDNTWDELVAVEDSLASIEAQIANALTASRRSVEQAENSLTAAQNALEAASEPADQFEIQLAEDDILLAKLAVATANDALTDLSTPVEPTDPLEVRLAEDDILLAEAALASANDALSDLGDADESADPLEVQLATDAMLLAEVALIAARDALTDLSTPDETQVALVNAEIVVAEGRLADAIATLEDLRLIGTDEALIALRSAELDSAVAAQVKAKDTLDATSLTATMDGVVDAVSFEVGDTVRPQDTVIALVDPDVVTVETAIDQLDILVLAVGAEASVSLDALTGEVLSGEISEIGTATLDQSGTVSFPVTIVLNLQPGVELLEGLSATVDIVTSEIADVLLVPAAAIGGTFIQPTLNITRDGQSVSVPVTLGGGNETFAVINSGVVEGEIVSFTLPDIGSSNPFDAIRIGSGFTTFGAGRQPGGGGGNIQFRAGGGR